MSVLRPVIELGPQMVVVSGAISAEDIGAFVAQLARQACPDGRDASSVDTDEAPAWVVAAIHDDAVLVSGGLRAADDAGFWIDPGCCCDLNDWRDWAEFADRPEIWLGHSPDPWIEYSGAGLRVNADRGPASKGWVEFSNAELPELLSAVQQDLVGFLNAVSTWTAAHAPLQEEAFVAALDQILRVTQPLPWNR